MENITLVDTNLETTEFERGIMVLPVEYTKGLEFDAVLIFHPSKEQYPAQDQYVKLLYVAATRALHELAIVHLDDLTELIAKPVSAEKRMQLLASEIEIQSERKQRVTQILKEEKVIDTRILPKTMLERRNIGLDGKPKAVQSTVEQMISQAEVEKEHAGTKEHKENTVTKTSTLSKKWVPKSGVEQPQNTSLHQFLDIPGSSELYPKGHSRIDSSIRWVKKSKNWIDLVSSYGVLRLIPLKETMIRVQFKKGQAAEFEPGYWNYIPDVEVNWNAREGRTQFEVATAQLVIRIDKKTGAMQFFDKKGTVLLMEKSVLPRQVEGEGVLTQTWSYFDWPKNEKISAKGILDDSLERLDQKARYISFGGKSLRMPFLTSGKGYGIGIVAENTVMCCNLSMYGPYVYTEGMKQIDYYFMYGEYDKTLGMYKEIVK